MRPCTWSFVELEHHARKRLHFNFGHFLGFYYSHLEKFDDLKWFKKLAHRSLTWFSLSIPAFMHSSSVIWTNLLIEFRSKGFPSYCGPKPRSFSRSSKVKAWRSWPIAISPVCNARSSGDEYKVEGRYLFKTFESASFVAYFWDYLVLQNLIPKSIVNQIIRGTF